MTEHYTHDNERAALSLPDVTGAATAKAATNPARLSVAELKAALAGLSDTERGELLAAIGGKRQAVQLRY